MIQNKLIVLLNHITKTYITKNVVYLFLSVHLLLFLFFFFFLNSNLFNTLFMENFFVE